MNILNFFRAENLWPYITGEKDIPRNDDYTIYYRSARDFGKLCAITSLQKASSNPLQRPIDYDFVDIYNGITSSILANIEMDQIDKVGASRFSMKKLEILSEYIGPVFTDRKTYEKGLKVVLEGDITGVYVPDDNIVNEEYRKEVIGNFIGCLLAFMNCYGKSDTKEILNCRNQYKNNNNKTR